MIDESKYNGFQEPIIDKNNIIFKIIGIFLIIAGIISIFSWIPYAGGEFQVTQDIINTLNLTQEQVIESLILCGIIGIILSIFPILGGILVIKKKYWIVTIFCGIIGLFTVGILLLSSIISFICVILLFIYRKEF